MKKIALSFSVVLLLLSCSENSALTELDNTESTPTTRGVINSKYNSLGVSYDATENFLDIDGTKYPVVDIDAFLAKNPNSFIQNTTTKGSIEYYSGSDATSFINEVKSKNSISIGITPFKISGGNEKNTKITSTTQYSYGRGDVVKRVKRIYLNADPAILQDYLYPEFTRDLNKYSADQFVKMYGTHVLLDITIGGALQFTYRSTIEEYGSTVDKKKSVEAGLKFQIGSYGADQNNSQNNQTIQSLNRNNSSWKVWIDYIGGTNSGLSVTYDTNSKPSTTFKLSDWESSVNESNSGIIELNWNKTYPIYDFIKDPTKKAQIKAAVDKYIKDNTPVMVKMKALYRLYRDKQRQSFFSSSLGECQVYNSRFGYRWDSGDNLYPNQSATIGYIYATQQPGTKPLYRLYKDKTRQSFLTSSSGEADVYIKRFGYRYDDGDDLYPGQGHILGYVATSENKNNVPLYRLYRDNIRNTFITASLGEANTYISRIGYRYDDGDDLYPGQGHVLGYLSPSKQ